MPVTFDVARSEPAAGSGRCSSNACSAWTSIAGSKSPIRRAPGTWASSTAYVGSTCWSTPSEFSVVNASSSSGSPTPAPTPTAYRSASFDVQERSCGGDSTPIALRSRAISGAALGRTAVRQDVRRGLLDQAGDDRAELGRIPAGALVGARPGAPALRDADHAAAHIEDPAGDAAGLAGGEPDDQRRDVVGGARIEV